MPSITSWTRLEPRSGGEDIEAGLRAAVHDPLWLLARQWQLGEFAGEDAGTPVSVRARVERLTLSRYHPGRLPPGGRVQGASYRPDELPLETLVEREPVRPPPPAADDLRLAAEAGARFLALLERHGAPGLRQAFRVAYPLPALGAPSKPASAAVAAAAPDPANARFLALVAGRLPDGRRVYEALVAAGETLPAQPAVPDTQRAAVLAAAREYRGWYEQLFAEPPGGASSWMPERMEYAFALSARSSAGEVTVAADEYHGGRLDWHSCDLAAATATLGAHAGDPAPEIVTRTAIPAGVRYRGMPAGRWWELEDTEVNFGRVEAAPDELLRMLIVEFALTYGNDWFIVPLELAPGALYRWQSIVVTDGFGERTLVPHYGRVDATGAGFRLFALSGGPPDLLYLPPVVEGGLSGPPVEEVLLLRDEMANLAWAVEKRAPGTAGLPVDRFEDYQRRRAAAPAEPERGEDPVYRLASPVPDYWTPLVPVRPDPDAAAIRLRRGRVLLDAGGEPVLPPVLGRVLAPERPLEIFEEEVPRAGARIVRAFQLARWHDGSTHLWLGRQKTAWRGEGFSGLRHDLLE